MNENSKSRLTPTSQPRQRREDPKVLPVTEHFGSTGQSSSEAGSEIDLLQLLGVFWRGKWIIFVCAILVMLAGGYYAYFVAVPIYTATARLALQVRDQRVVSLESVMSGVSTEQSAINTEIEVIKSRGLIERLVADLNLLDDPEFNLTLREPPVWSLREGLEFVTNYIPIIPVPEERTLTREEILIKTVTKAGDALAVSSQRATYIFDIRATTTDPDKSRAMANRLAEIYLEDQIGIKFEATEYAIDWLSDRVSELEFELRDKEDSIKDLRTETQLISIEALEALNIRAKDLRERLTQAQLSVADAEDMAARLTAVADVQNLKAIAATLEDSILERLLSAGDGPVSRRQFLARVQELTEEAEVRINRERLQRETLQASYELLQRQISEQNTDLAKLNQLVREADATRVLYETFLTRLKETSVQIGLQNADSRILSEATPGLQVAPRPATILAMSIIFGALIGAGVLLLRQFLHHGFRTSVELERVSGYTVMGQIPKMPLRRRKRLVSYLRSKPASAAAEAVRNLRTSVLLSKIDNPPTVLMSTSSIQSEGKTTLSIALAHNLSGLGKKVLLIEGDIRRRTFTQYFNQDPGLGLVSVISGQKTIEEVVVHDADLGADVLMGDKSSVNAADLFSSEKFAVFMNDIREMYDFIIIDTPPVLIVPDARLIGRFADSIIYTVAWDSTAQSQVLDGLRQFSSVGLRVDGLVLSQIDPSRLKRYGYGGKSGAFAQYGSNYYEV